MLDDATIPAFPGEVQEPAGSTGAPTPVPAAGPRPSRHSSRTRKGSPPPVLVEVIRGYTSESRHRGHVIEIDAGGRVVRAVGAPATEITLRSTVKPFAAVALIESGAADDLALTPSELAVMCASHTGEDKHVRTLQAVFRRASVTQALLQCGTAGAPSDERTATRLARDGETAGPIRHGCSGFHAASILMSAYAGWTLDDYTDPRHPSQRAVLATVARLFGRDAASLRTATDNCGLLTYEVTLLELARAYLLLADPVGSTSGVADEASTAALLRIRDAMMTASDLVGGTFDNLDTELMRRRPGGLVAKAGADGLRAVGIVPTDGRAAGAVAVKIEDGDGSRRALSAASVEALAQVGLLDERDLRALAVYHHPTAYGPAGQEAATALPRFELVSGDGR